MAWLRIFHAQGIAQDCISHGGLAAVQGVKCLSWKTPSRFPKLALLGRGILDVIGRKLAEVCQALFCCFVWLCVSMCLCVKVLLVTNGLLFEALRLGRNFLSQSCWEPCWGMWAWDSVLNWNEIEFILGKNSFLPLPWKNAREGVKNRGFVDAKNSYKTCF